MEYSMNFEQSINGLNVVLLALVGSVALNSAAMAGCPDLMGRQFADTEIGKAEPVASGEFTPQDRSGAPAAAFTVFRLFVASWG